MFNMKKEEQLKKKIARAMEVKKMRDDRYTYREIGEKFGFTKQRAKQIHNWILELQAPVDNAIDKSKE